MIKEGLEKLVSIPAGGAAAPAAHPLCPLKTTAADCSLWAAISLPTVISRQQLPQRSSNRCVPSPTRRQKPLQPRRKLIDQMRNRLQSRRKLPDRTRKPLHLRRFDRYPLFVCRKTGKSLPQPAAPHNFGFGIPKPSMRMPCRRSSFLPAECAMRGVSGII